MSHPHEAGGLPAPRHHPMPETLVAFASGNMRAGFDVVVAAHLKTCAQCRADVALLEHVGGRLLSEIDTVGLGKGALAATLARLDEPVHPPALAPVKSLDRLLSGARRRWVAPGVWTAKVETPHDPADRVFLLKVAPGAATARHTHAGPEFTQVLEGALEDEGIVYRAGDFVELGEDHVHRPQVHGSEPCLCLFATQGRLVPTDLIGRIAFAIANV